MLSKQKPKIHNAGAPQLPTRSISVIAVQAPIELNTKHSYQLNGNDDLSSDIIPLEVNHRINHKYPKLLNIPLLTTEYDKVHIPRKATIGNLQPLETENKEINNIFWTEGNPKTAISLLELLSMPSESGFHPEQKGLK